MSKKIKRGDIYLANLDYSDSRGSIQTGVRPVIVYSNDTNNIYCKNIQMIPISGVLKYLCVHVVIEGCGLDKKSMAYAEQINTIDKKRLIMKIGELTDEYMESVDEAVDIQLGRKRINRNKKEEAA